MKRIAFVTDSTACLSQAQQEHYGIEVVPLQIVLGGESFREGVDLRPSEYYQRLSQTKEFPTTSQPSVGEFAEVFERLLGTHESIVGLFLSSELSGTMNSARQAADMVGGDIHIVDSRISSYGIAGPLMDGAELAQKGCGIEEILDLWREELATMHAYFVVDTLEMLHRGGRIGGASAAFGAMLQIKPILTIQEGRIGLFEKIRTHRKAIERISGLFDASMKERTDWQLGVVHSARENDARNLRDELCAEYPGLMTDMSELGPVIGSHTGPGVLALVYYQQRLPGGRSWYEA